MFGNFLLVVCYYPEFSSFPFSESLFARVLCSLDILNIKFSYEGSCICVAVGKVCFLLLTLSLCSGYSWLSTWLYLEWTTIQNWKAHLWCWSGRWEIEVSDLDLGMEILRHSGYGFQKIKSSSSRSSGIKGVVEHTFNLGYTFCWRQYKDIGRRESRSCSLTCLLCGTE